MSVCTVKAGNREVEMTGIGDSRTVGQGSGLGAWRLGAHGLYVTQGIAPVWRGSERSQVFAGDDHEGHGSYTSTLMAAAYAVFSAAYPTARLQLAMILLGTNDVLAPADFRPGMNALLDGTNCLYARWPGIRIVLGTVPRTWDGAGGGATETYITEHAAINADMATIAAERTAAGKVVTVADMASVATVPGDTQDGVHLTAAAYERCGRIFAAAGLAALRM